MSEFFDFNTAEVRGDFSELIPDNTVAVVVAKLRPGRAGPSGWLKATNDGNALLADLEFTVEGGPFDRRKFWDTFIVECGPNATEGQRTAANISRSVLRSMIESAYGVLPADDSDTALAKRRVAGYQAFDGMRFCAKVAVEKGDLKPGQQGPNGERYPDKNRLRAAVTADNRHYISPGETASAGGFAGQPATTAGPAPGGFAPAQQQAAAPIAKPAWAS